MNNIQLRQRALEMAVDMGSPEQVLEAAQAYYDFMLGRSGDTQNAAEPPTIEAVVTEDATEDEDPFAGETEESMQAAVAASIKRDGPLGHVKINTTD